MNQKAAFVLLLAAGVGTLAWMVSRNEAQRPKTPAPHAVAQIASQDPAASPANEVEPAGAFGKKAPPKGDPADPQSPATLGKKAITALKDDPVGTIFKFGQKTAKVIDSQIQNRFKLTDAEEIEVGAKINRKVLMQHRTIKDNVARLEALAKPVLETRARKQIPFTFDVIDRKEINAFSHVGGYVYMFQGILDEFDDTAIQFVLAHEIAHVDLGHCSEKALVQARVGEAKGELFGTLAQIGYAAIEAGYSEDKEYDADEWAYRCLVKLGKDRKTILQFLARLSKDEKAPNQTKGKKVLDRLGEELSGHFRTHPPSIDRIRRLEAIKVD